jgi:hypothetical protein
VGDADNRGGVQRAAQGIFGSLREALAAASRDETQAQQPAAGAIAPPLPLAMEKPLMLRNSSPVAAAPSAAEAAREARGGTPNIPPADSRVEIDPPPTTRVLRGAVPGGGEAPARTQLVRGKSRITRQSFHQDPVVGWLVIVGGPGLGAYRPIYEGNNTIGRAATQRIPLDFGDEAISSEEQAYIRYDGGERGFLFVPNLAKTNVVAVNEKRPTSAVQLQSMDLITMGRTQLVFVPLCGPDFDWGDIGEAKA